MMAASLAPDAARVFDRFQRNLRWAKTHDRELDSHEGEYVAVDDGKIIASGPSQNAVESKVVDLLGVYVTFVPKRDLIWVL